MRSSGCSTAKVKVAEKGQTLADDVERVEAVRDAIGPQGKVRVDANGGWSVDEAISAIAALNIAAHGLEYVEQPCASVEDLAAVRRKVGVPIAADESIRRADDPFRVVELEAADIAVLKVAPLGGVHACLRIAEQIGLPVVVSSAVETSIGLAAGLALAGCAARAAVRLRPRHHVAARRRCRRRAAQAGRRVPPCRAPGARPRGVRRGRRRRRDRRPLAGAAVGRTRGAGMSSTSRRRSASLDGS